MRNKTTHAIAQLVESVAAVAFLYVVYLIWDYPSETDRVFWVKASVIGLNVVGFLTAMGGGISRHFKPRPKYPPEDELADIKHRAIELWLWCGYEFPQVGCAAKWLLDPYDSPAASGTTGTVSQFREALRNGGCTQLRSIKSRRGT